MAILLIQNKAEGLQKKVVSPVTVVVRKGVDNTWSYGWVGREAAMHY